MKFVGIRKQYGVEVEIDKADILKEVAKLIMSKAGMSDYYWVDNEGSLKGNDLSYHGSPDYETIREKASD